MNQFQSQAIIDFARKAITATDKALSALMAYERKPDPMLIEVAIDYLEETSRKHLRNVEAFAAGANDLEDTAHG